MSRLGRILVDALSRVWMSFFFSLVGASTVDSSASCEACLRKHASDTHNSLIASFDCAANQTVAHIARQALCLRMQPLCRARCHLSGGSGSGSGSYCSLRHNVAVIVLLIEFHSRRESNNTNKKTRRAPQVTCLVRYISARSTHELRLR